jgi:ABC-2 type transport system permease protein
MDFNFPPPTAVQSLTGYAGDMGQLGVFVVVLIAMGSIANELSRGTALMVLSKPVGRPAFVTSKLLALSITTVVSLFIASAVCFAYTVWLIEGAAAAPFIGMTLLLALFMVFCITTTLLFSSLFRSSLAAGGVALGVIIGQAILSALPYVGDYLPGKLLGWGNNLLTGGHAYWGALTITVVLIVLFVYLAQRSLKTRDI